MRTSTAATKFLNNLLQNNFVISFEQIPSKAFGRMKKKKSRMHFEQRKLGPTAAAAAAYTEKEFTAQ